MGTGSLSLPSQVARTDVPSGRARGHVVVIVPDYLPALGGTTTQSRAHALELVRRGWRVTVLTRRVHWGGGREQLDGVQVRRVSVPGRSRLAKLPSLACHWWWLVRHRRAIDAVSVIMDADFAVCCRLAAISAPAAVTWVTNGDARRQLSGRKGALRRRALGGCSHVVLSEAMSAELRETAGFFADVIPVPVDLVAFRPPGPAERAVARQALDVRDARAVVSVGHLQARKGIRQLVEATHVLRDRGLDVVLFVVGGPVEPEDATYAEGVRRLARDRGLEAFVRFVGPTPDVLPYLWAADVFCLASEREGTPNVLLEAMACGVPCVAPPSAGGNELLAGGAGWVPPSNDPADLAAAISSVLTPTAGTRMAKMARERVERDHRVAAVVDRYEDVLGLSRCRGGRAVTR